MSHPHLYNQNAKHYALSYFMSLFCGTDGIVSYVLKQAAPAYKEISNDADLEKALSQQNGVVVGEWCNCNLRFVILHFNKVC